MEWRILFNAFLESFNREAFRPILKKHINEDVVKSTMDKVEGERLLDEEEEEPEVFTAVTSFWLEANPSMAQINTATACRKHAPNLHVLARQSTSMDAEDVSNSQVQMTVATTRPASNFICTSESKLN